jgi:hypothetical protein
MNIVQEITQFNDDFIYFCKPIKNNIINEGKFIKIIYSTPHFVLNGIYLRLEFCDIITEKYYNKFKCSFNPYFQKELIEFIKNMEEKILKKANIQNKIPTTKIYEQFKSGNIKVFTSDQNLTVQKVQPCVFLLKISGIWETDINYGITFKFIVLPRV